MIDGAGSPDSAKLSLPFSPTTSARGFEFGHSVVYTSNSHLSTVL
jgi:hypothetical protein